MYTIGVTTSKYGVLDRHTFKFGWVPPELIGVSLPDHLPDFYAVLNKVFPAWREYFVSHTISAVEKGQG